MLRKADQGTSERQSLSTTPHVYILSNAETAHQFIDAPYHGDASPALEYAAIQRPLTTDTVDIEADMESEHYVFPDGILEGSHEYIVGDDSSSEVEPITHTPLETEMGKEEAVNRGAHYCFFDNVNCGDSDSYIDNWPNEETIVRYKERCAKHKRYILNCNYFTNSVLILSSALATVRRCKWRYV